MSLVRKGKIERQFPYTTTFEEKAEAGSNRTDVVRLPAERLTARPSRLTPIGRYCSTLMSCNAHAKRAFVLEHTRLCVEEVYVEEPLMACSRHQYSATLRTCSRHQYSATLTTCSRHQYSATLRTCSRHQYSATLRTCSRHQYSATLRTCSRHQYSATLRTCSRHQYLKTLRTYSGTSIRQHRGPILDPVFRNTDGLFGHQYSATLRTCSRHQYSATWKRLSRGKGSGVIGGMSQDMTCW